MFNHEKLVELVKLDKRQASDIKCSINLNNLDIDNVSDIIVCYNEIVGELPYPISDLERDIKYNAIALYLTSQLDVVIRVDNGLHVQLDKYRALYLFKDKWCIYDIDEDIKSNVKDMLEFVGELGYRELDWVVEKLEKGSSLKDYYTVMESEEALNLSNEEIERALRGLFNNKVNSDIVMGNCILVKDTGEQYRIDFILDGIVEVDTGETIWKMVGNDVESVKKLEKRNVYECKLQAIKDGCTIECDRGYTVLNKYKCLDRLQDMLEDDFNDTVGVIQKRGIILDNDFVVEVDGTIYHSNALVDCGLVPVASGKIVRLDVGKLYVEDDGVVTEIDLDTFDSRVYSIG